MLLTTAIGHIGGDAVCQVSNGNEFTTFRVAHTDKWTNGDGTTTENTIWVDCIMQGRPNVMPYLKKGQKVFITGTTSLRIYSSPKDKCMKAGITIHVRNLELLGTKTDDIPSKLFTEDGKIEVMVYKHYNVPQLTRDKKGAEFVNLVSQGGEKFIVDRNGWVIKPETEG